MNTTRFLHVPEVSQFEMHDRIVEGLEDQYDWLQYQVRRNKLDYSIDALHEGSSLREGILQAANDNGFDFLDRSTVEIMYCEPGTIIKPQIARRGLTLTVTSTGDGTYFQYPNTDEFKDRVGYEKPIRQDEAEHVRAVTEGSALLTNQSIPHSFRTGVFPYSAFRITA